MSEGIIKIPVTTKETIQSYNDNFGRVVGAMGISIQPIGIMPKLCILDKKNKWVFTDLN